MYSSNKKIKVFRILIALAVVVCILREKKIVYAHNTPATWRQSSFWFRDDDAGEPCDSVPSCTTGATGYGSPDTDADTSLTNFTVGDAFRLRLALVKNNPGDLSLTTTPLLEFKAGGTTGDCTADSWTTVPTETACGSTAICQASSDNFADGLATTVLLSALADYGGDMVETDGSADTSATFSTGNGTDTAEWEWMLDTDNAAESTTYTFRLSKDSPGTPYSTYTVCPTLTTSSGAVPSYTHNDFEWFVTAASVTLSNVWPPGGGENLAENAALTQFPASNEPLDSGDQIRIQMNITAGTAPLSASSQAFRLEYDAAEDCTAATGWAPVGGTGSGTIWRLFDQGSIGPSTTQVNDISTSTASAEGYYSEINPTGSNPNEVLVGENSEWDWPVENNGATANTTYCFRMALDDGTPLDIYNTDSYPKVTTEPAPVDLMRHGKIFQNQQKRGFFWAD